jgi:hypothetical protein
LDAYVARQADNTFLTAMGLNDDNGDESRQTLCKYLTATAKQLDAEAAKVGA